MSHRIRTYLAGPYTIPDPITNTRRMMAAFDAVLDAGFLPFCPLWSHFQHEFSPRDYETWMAFDLEWLSACEVLLRLPGESPGADREVAHARASGIAVVHSIEELIEWGRTP